jgi:tetratricopeptide (TPR) repeat protein
MIAGRHPFFKNMFNTGMSGPTRADVSLLGNEIDGLSSNITNVVSNLFRSLYFGVEHWIESIQKVSAYYKRQQIALRDMLARLQSITQLDAIKGLHDVQSPTFRRILNTADALQPAFQAVGNFLTGAFQYPEFVESIRQLSQSMLEVQKVDNGQMTKALHEIQAKIQGTADAPLKNLLDHIGKQTHEQNGPANSHFQPQQIEAMQRLANLTEIPGEGFDAKYITKLLQSIVLDRKLSRGTSELRNLTELSQFQSHIESCLMTQEFDTALDCLDAWSQSHTLNALTYGLWGICLSATLDEFEAQTKMQQALQLDPSLLDIQTNLAMSFTKTNDFELAANAYQTVIELAQTQAKPPSPIWHADLSTCLFAVGEIDLAAFHLQKAITIQKMPEFLQKEKLYQEIRV